MLYFVVVVEVFMNLKLFHTVINEEFKVLEKRRC